MLPQATRSPDADEAGVWQTLARHQLGAMVAGGLDFGAMILCVESLDASPVAGTVVGEALGALVNFWLGRGWIFHAAPDHPANQALRYAVVSAASGGWNALGEYLLHDVARVQYVVARALVAVAVSLCWNFPVQRRFVFREGRAK